MNFSFIDFSSLYFSPCWYLALQCPLVSRPTAHLGVSWRNAFGLLWNLPVAVPLNVPLLLSKSVSTPSATHDSKDLYEVSCSALFHLTKDSCSPAGQSPLTSLIPRNPLDSFGSRLKGELQDQVCERCWGGSWPTFELRKVAATFTHLTWSDGLPMKSTAL